jgi:hypothetical protein
VCLQGNHREQMCDNWWSAACKRSVSCNNACNNPRGFENEKSAHTVCAMRPYARTTTDDDATMLWASHKSQ